MHMICNLSAVSCVGQKSEWAGGLAVLSDSSPRPPPSSLLACSPPSSQPKKSPTCT